MELKYYYKLTFINNSEFIIESYKDSIEELKNELRSNSMFGAKREYIIIQHNENVSPLHILADKVLSIQKYDEEVNSRTRVWRLL